MQDSGQLSDEYLNNYPLHSLSGVSIDRRKNERKNFFPLVRLPASVALLREKNFGCKWTHGFWHVCLIRLWASSSIAGKRKKMVNIRDVPTDVEYFVGFQLRRAFLSEWVSDVREAEEGICLRRVGIIRPSTFFLLPIPDRDRQMSPWFFGPSWLFKFAASAGRNDRLRFDTNANACQTKFVCFDFSKKNFTFLPFYFAHGGDDDQFQFVCLDSVEPILLRENSPSSHTNMPHQVNDLAWPPFSIVVTKFNVMGFSSLIFAVLHSKPEDRPRLDSFFPFRWQKISQKFSPGILICDKHEGMLK